MEKVGRCEKEPATYEQPEQTHVQAHNNESTACPDCGKVLTTSNMNQHIQKKHSRGFECETCGKKYPGQSRLRSESFECETCGKRFPEESSLKEHVPAHTRERLHYFCDTCGKS